MIYFLCGKNNHVKAICQWGHKYLIKLFITAVTCGVWSDALRATGCPQFVTQTIIPSG